MTPNFIGPRQITASSFSLRRNPIDITLRLSPISSGWIESSVPCSGKPSTPRSLGTLGPWISTSSRPTFFPAAASTTARFTATVLLPTPPLPESTRTLCPIIESLFCIFSSSFGMRIKPPGACSAMNPFQSVPRRPSRCGGYRSRRDRPRTPRRSRPRSAPWSPLHRSVRRPAS